MQISDIAAELDKLPINAFDLVLLIVLMLGLRRGRTRGMSEELLDLLKWVTVLFGCSLLYQPVGQFIAETVQWLGPLSSYLIGYAAVGGMILILFTGLKHALGGKLVGSDIFGRGEYYLGMAAGSVRFASVLLIGLAILNARHFTSTEVKAMQKFQDDVYGSNFFPTLHTMQAGVFERSLTGPWIKENLGFLLIKATDPVENRNRPREIDVL